MTAFCATLLAALLYASAGPWTAHACQPGLARDVAQSIADVADAEGSGVDVLLEGSGLEALIDHIDAITASNDCLLLSYSCPADAACVEPTEDTPGIRSCGDHSDYQLRVAGGDGPYASIRCVSGVWYAPSGQSLDAVLDKNPTLYCIRFVPDEQLSALLP